MVTRPRNAESEIDEGLVGVLILAPTFLRVDVAAGKVARREVKRVSSPNCVHMRTLHLHYTISCYHYYFLSFYFKERVNVPCKPWEILSFSFIVATGPFSTFAPSKTNNPD